MTFPELTSDPIVSIVPWKDGFIIATANNLYRLRDGKLEILEFEYIGSSI